MALTKKEQAVAILMLYAAQTIPPADAVKACQSQGIEKRIIVESVNDLEEFRKKLGEQ